MYSLNVVILGCDYSYNVVYTFVIGVVLESDYSVDYSCDVVVLSSDVENYSYCIVWM